MGGFFAAALKEDCIFDLFFGTDYHSHLGTRRGGLAAFDRKDGFCRSIHDIGNSPFRTKFSAELNEMRGNLGIGCISDYDPQPLLLRSQHGSYAIAAIGKINNQEELLREICRENRLHFFEMTSGEINQTELVAALINQRDHLVEGIRYAQERIDGSMSILILTKKGIYAARDLYGRTPVILGRKKEGFCASFESFAYLNLGYRDYREMGPGEISIITPEGVTVLAEPGKRMKICSFLWIYYGYPSSKYEGVSVEAMRCRCGAMLAKRDRMSREDADIVAGVPDSGTAHAIGYANASGIPFSRPLIKYTPTWPRSFMPPTQKKRELIARMKLIPVKDLIEGRRILLIDDSIVRGTQLRETGQYLFDTGAKEIHARPACPPLLFGCKYLGFSRSGSELEMIARRVIREEEGDAAEESVLKDYANPDSERFRMMQKRICERMHFTSLRYNRLDDTLAAVGIPAERLCTYCWNGEE